MGHTINPNQTQPLMGFALASHLDLDVLGNGGQGKATEITHVVIQRKGKFHPARRKVVR